MLNKTPLKNNTLAATSPVSAQLIRVKYSLVLAMLGLALHCAAIIAIWLTSLPLWSIFFCSVLLVIHGGACCHYWRSATDYRLQKNQEGGWTLYSESNSGQFITLQHCYYWSRYLIIFRVKSHRQHCFFYPVLFDSCHRNGGIDSVGFRHLRVLAKYLL
ncbi:MAG: hypothetical protein ACJAUP_001221 [Cellvibrionaceae bacterium]|jgi:hypothetical protein